MVGLYQKKNPEYSVRGFIFKPLRDNDGSFIAYEDTPSNQCDLKDYGFKTVYVKTNGHIEKYKVGKLETLDLKEDELMPDDIIEYANVKYTVTSVTFEDDEKEKRKSLRPSGKTTIEVRK